MCAVRELIVFVGALPGELCVCVSHRKNLHLVMILERSRIDISCRERPRNRQLTAQVKRQGNQESVRCGRADQERAQGGIKIARISDIS